MKLYGRILTAMLLSCMSISTYGAGLLSDNNNQTCFTPWLIRVRGIVLVPQESSSTIPIIGGEVTEISSVLSPELDINYFFTCNIAAELILEVSRHSVKATGTALGSVDLGKVNLLPPTLTAVYHFMPEQCFDPYVGVGINYTHFFNIDDGPIADNITYDDCFGAALQVGIDVRLCDHFFFNADIKKIYLKTDVKVEALGETLKTDVKIHPWIFGVGFGYRF